MEQVDFTKELCVRIKEKGWFALDSWIERCISHRTGDECTRNKARQLFERWFEKHGRENLNCSYERWDSWLRRKINLLVLDAGRWCDRRSTFGETFADTIEGRGTAELSPEYSEIVRQCITKLPTRQRHVLLLLWRGYSPGEIAEILGLHNTDVAKLRTSSRQSFRECLAKHLDLENDS